MEEVEHLGLSLEIVGLDGGPPPDRFCIEERNCRWYVYYSEKERWEEESFDSEDEACDDPTDAS